MPNTLHWHGIFHRGALAADGTPGVSQIAIPPGGNFTYRFSTDQQYGFYWYHSHFRGYYSDGLHGPILIHPNPARTRPFSVIATNDTAIAQMMQAERKPQNLMIGDWYHDMSDDIWSRYAETGLYPFCVDSILINGKAQVGCLSEDVLDTSSIVDQTIEPTEFTPHECTSAGVNIVHTPNETCGNTTSPLTIISVDPSKEWMALNLVNTGSVSALSFSIDSHSMWIYAVDGLYVSPREYLILTIHIGQRYQVLVPLTQTSGNFFIRAAAFPTGCLQQVLQSKAILSYSETTFDPNMVVNEDDSEVWMLTNGSATNGATMLDPNIMLPAHMQDSSALSGQPANVTFRFFIQQTGNSTWTISAYTLGPAKTHDQASSLNGSNVSAKYRVPANATVDIILEVPNTSLNNMGHPIYLHGHKFWILGSGPGSFPYASVTNASQDIISFQNPPYRDLAYLPEAGWLALRYVAHNPGAWMLQSHVQWALMGGAGLVLTEAASNASSVLRTPRPSHTAMSQGFRRSVVRDSTVFASLCLAFAFLGPNKILGVGIANR